MKTNLKDNIWIEGFDDESRSYASRDFKIMQGCRSVWIGKTSEIPEEIAKECVKRNKFYLNYLLEKDIKENDWRNTFMFISAKESIQSACDKPYCIIYTTK